MSLVFIFKSSNLNTFASLQMCGFFCGKVKDLTKFSTQHLKLELRPTTPLLLTKSAVHFLHFTFILQSNKLCAGCSHFLVCFLSYLLQIEVYLGGFILYFYWNRIQSTFWDEVYCVVKMKVGIPPTCPLIWFFLYVSCKICGQNVLTLPSMHVPRFAW